VTTPGSSASVMWTIRRSAGFMGSRVRDLPRRRTSSATCWARLRRRSSRISWKLSQSTRTSVLSPLSVRISRGSRCSTAITSSPSSAKHQSTSGPERSTSRRSSPWRIRGVSSRPAMRSRSSTPRLAASAIGPVASGKRSEGRRGVSGRATRSPPGTAPASGARSSRA